MDRQQYQVQIVRKDGQQTILSTGLQWQWEDKEDAMAHLVDAMQFAWWKENVRFATVRKITQ